MSRAVTAALLVAVPVFMALASVSTLLLYPAPPDDEPGGRAITECRIVECDESVRDCGAFTDRFGPGRRRCVDVSYRLSSVDGTLHRRHNLTYYLTLRRHRVVSMPESQPCSAQIVPTLNDSEPLRCSYDRRAGSATLALAHANEEGIDEEAESDLHAVLLLTAVGVLWTLSLLCCLYVSPPPPP